MPKLVGGSPSGVPSAVKLLMTLVPLGNVALGNVTLTRRVQVWFGCSGTVQGLVQVTVAGVVPTQPGWQSAAGVAPLKTAPGGSVSVTGPMAVMLSTPLALALAMRNR